MTLSEMKLYLRVDGTDEDALITSLVASSSSYIKQQTGKTKKLTGETDPVTLLPVTAAIETDELYNLCLKLICSHWYENRGVEVAVNMTKLSHSVDALVNHIAMCGEYV